MVPFTVAEFLSVFERYNNAVWPAQLAFYLMALLAIGLTFKDTKASNKTVSIILAVLWLWMGVVYHLLFFSRINRAAILFGAVFIAQSIVFIFISGLRETVLFRFRRDLRGILGAVFIVYALVIYPLLGMSFGHNYPAAPTFGVPCPTTIFTFGILLSAASRIPVYALIIPLIWSVFGFWAALSLGMIEDFGLLITGVITTVMIAKGQSRAFSLRYNDK